MNTPLKRTAEDIRISKRAIHAYCERHGLTIGDLADKVKVPKQTLYRFTRRGNVTQDMHVAVFVKLAYEMQVTTDYLLGVEFDGSE